MKKLLAIALALVLIYALSVTAMAEGSLTPTNTSGETKVNFNVAPSYTVTIPSTITLSPNTVAGVTTYISEGVIEATNVRLVKDKVLKVTLASDFTMTTGSGNATYELPYTVTVGDPAIAIPEDKTIATFTTSTEAQSVTLHFEAENPTYAGAYSDTVTFNLSVE